MPQNSNQRSLAKVMVPSGSAVQTISGTALARLRKRSSLARSAASARLPSVMSRAILEAPMISPASSRIGETVREIWISLPSLRRRTVS